MGIHEESGLSFKLLMERFVLTNAQWAQMEPHCLGKPTDPERSGRENRLLMEGVLWIVRTGQSVAVPACSVRQLKHGIPTLQRRPQCRCFQTDF